MVVGEGGTVGLIRSQGWLAAATRSPTRGGTRERRETGEMYNAPLCLSSKLYAASTLDPVYDFHLSPSSFSLCLSIGGFVRAVVLTDKPSLKKIRRRGRVSSMEARNELLSSRERKEGGGRGVCSLRTFRINIGICRVFSRNELANDVGWLEERGELRNPRGGCFFEKMKNEYNRDILLTVQLPDRSLSYKTRSRRIIRVVSTIKLYAVKN